MIFQRITKERACPYCKGSGAYRVKRAGLKVKLVCRILGVRPYWCPECDAFFLGPKRGEVRKETGYRASAPPRGGNQPQPGSLPQ